MESEKMAKAFGMLTFAVVGIFWFIILSTLTGALAGWTVGLVFSDSILGVLDKLGIHNVTMWQFGAFMGFCGGFMKTKVSAK